MRLSFSWFVDILSFLDSIFLNQRVVPGAEPNWERSEFELGESWAAKCPSCRNTRLKHQAPNEGVK